MLGIMVWESIPHYSTWDPLRNMNMGAHQHLSVFLWETSQAEPFRLQLQHRQDIAD